MPSQSRVGDAIYLFDGFSQEVGPDLALVHLNAPFTLNGSSSGFVNRLWHGSMSDLVNKTVASYGQGFPAYGVSPTGGVTCRGGSTGAYRAGDFTVSSTGLEPNAQVVAPATTTFNLVRGGRYASLVSPSTRRRARGDSGGPSFIFVDGVRYLVEILSATPCPINAAYGVAIPAVREWIAAVLRSQWHPATTSRRPRAVNSALRRE